MADPYTETFRGRAEFVGCGATFDVILYATEAIQSFDVTQTYEAEKVRNSRGHFISERNINEMLEANWNMKLVGNTQANARKLNTVNEGGFLPMQAVVVISDPASGPALPACCKGSFRVKSGMKISINNVSCGDLSIPLERYADADQNTLMTSTPV